MNILSLQINVIVDLPVGEHLQDHLKSDMGLFGIPGPHSLTPEKMNSWSEWFKYALFGTGNWLVVVLYWIFSQLQFCRIRLFGQTMMVNQMMKMYSFVPRAKMKGKVGFRA